jgi:cyanophycin synthetase
MAKLRTYYFEWLRVLQHLRMGWNRLRHPSFRPNGPGRTEFYKTVWRSAAAELAAEFEELPNGFCEIRRNGHATRMYENIVKIDDPLIVKLVRVKPFVSKQLQAHGIPVPAFREFTLDNIEIAEEFLRETRGPCVVKPTSGESAGTGVTTNVRTRRELIRAAVIASLSDRSLMIEQQVEGTSYRLLYLDGELLDATRRRPPTVIGNGHSSIRQLIQMENRRRAERKGSASLSRIQIDSDCRATLQTAGLSLNSVPESGREVFVKTAVNDNSANDNISVLDEIGEPLRRELARATEVLGIRFAGIDIITNNPSVTLKEGRGAVIEVNSSPGLHHHYNVRNPKPSTQVAIPLLKRLLNIQEKV